MEDQRPDVAADEEATPNPRLNEGFLKWLRGSQEVVDDTEEDDDEEETTPTKRWQRLLKRIFGGVVSKSEVKLESEAKKLPDISEVSSNNSSGINARIEQSDTLLIDHSQASMVDPESNINLAEPVNSREQIVTSEVPAEAVAAVDVSDLAYEDIPETPTESTASVEHAANSTEVSHDAPPIPYSYEPVERWRLERERREREQHDRLLKRKIHTLKHRVEKQEKQSREITKDAQKAEDERNFVRTQQLMFESRLNAREKAQPNKTVEAPSVIERSKETAIIEKKNTSVSPEHVTSLKAEAVTHISNRPEQYDAKEVLTKVSQAAEQNIAVERLYERSHEIKDEATPLVGDSATPVAKVIAKQQQELISRMQAQQRSSNQPKQPVPQATPLAEPELYKKAVFGGILGAIIVITLLIFLATK